MQKWQVRNHADTLTDLFVKDCVEQQNYIFSAGKKTNKKRKQTSKLNLCCQTSLSAVPSKIDVTETLVFALNVPS